MDQRKQSTLGKVSKDVIKFLGSHTETKTTINSL